MSPSPLDPGTDTAMVLAAWRQFMAGVPVHHPVRRVILGSWERSRRLAVDPRGRPLALHRIGDEELHRRLIAADELVHAARPHLQALSDMMLGRPHVTYLVDHDGIVLDVIGNAAAMIQEFGLQAGYDWSERRMGTNGAGTALAAKRPVAIVGPEHFIDAFHDCTCTGAPIFASTGDVLGAIDVSTAAADARPEQLTIVTYVAQMVEQEVRRRASNSSSQSVLRPPSGSEATVCLLNVDDDETARYAKSRLLRAAGYHVEEAATGQEALELARRYRPALVCLDVQLPDLHGMEVLRRLRADPWTAAAMVLQVSAAFCDTETKIEGLELGADAYLATPYEPAELLAMIKTLLRIYQTGQALRESEERFRRVFETGPMGMALVAPDYCLLAVNESFCRITGYAEHELLGRTFLEITHPDDCAADDKQSELLFEGVLPTSSMEKRYIRKTGEPVWVNLTRSLVRDDNGVILYGIAIVEDISERKRQAARIEEQANLLRIAPVMIRDDEGRIVFWTEKLAELYGWSEQEVLGRQADPLLRTQFSDPRDTAYAALDCEGEWIGEVSRSSRDGRRVIVASHWLRYRDESGRKVVLEVNADVTALRQAHQVLQEHQALIAAILSHTSAVIYLMDAQSRFVLVNRQFEELFQLSNEEIRGKSVDEVFPIEYARAFQEHNHQVLVLKQPMEFEEVAPSAEGPRYYASVKAPILDAAGQPTHVVGVSTDITDRRHAAHQIEVLLSEARERQRLLEEKQVELVHAGKLASLADLITGVAHELNNPLNNISLLLDNALDKIEAGMAGRKLRDQLLSDVRYAIDQAHRAAEVVRQLRAFGGHVPQPWTRHDLSPILNAAIEAVMPDCGRKGIRIGRKLHRGPLLVNATELLLRQAMMNVLRNAAEALEHADEKELIVSSQPEEGQAVVRIRDAGCGIPPAILGRIFDPFFTTKEVGKGKGLGLSTAYGIIKAHRGEIRVESTPGAGTLVTIRVPLMSAYAETGHPHDLMDAEPHP